MRVKNNFNRICRYTSYIERIRAKIADQSMRTRNQLPGTSKD